VGAISLYKDQLRPGAVGPCVGIQICGAYAQHVRASVWPAIEQHKLCVLANSLGTVE
jgi:hypothetical protein